MIKLRLAIFGFLLSSFFASAQKKNTWLRRNWNNMVAHYNVYYHGQKILNETVEDLIPQHKDDFSKPIEVYPYSDEATAATLKPKMEEVMKKASVVISKRPRSKWVDDCFLMIGKSHFFRGDLFSADEAFQFVNSQYSDRPIRYYGQLWILKTMVRQGKINDAEAIFKTFQRDEVFPAHLQDDLNCVAGDIYTKMGLYPEAQKYLEAGLLGTKNKVLRYRIHFLLAQLYLLTKDYDKARAHYRRVVKSSAPYEFAFQSNIGIVKTNSLAGKSDTRESRRNLKKMLKDDKNIDYYGQLYYELGNLDYADKNYAKAVKNYQSAVKKSSRNQDLKTDAYLQIAKIHYENKNYRLAEKFFDSTAMFITEKHPEYERIKQQQSVLSTLINHLITIETQDSLLRLADMPKDKLEEEIRKIMAREKELKKKAAAKKNKESESVPDVQPINNSPTQYTGTDQFIFDNQAMLGREYNDFVKRWGNRKLTDNWRISAIKKDLVVEPEVEPRDTAEVKKDGSVAPEGGEVNSPNDLKKYYTGIPFTEKDKQLAYKKILESHYEAGKIYLEKLREYKEAVFHFESANTRFPANTYEAEMLYYLVKCFEALPDNDRAKTTKKTLTSKYPNSEYSQVLENKDSTKPAKAESNDKKEKKEVMEAYEKMYAAYEAGNYEGVKKIKLEADQKYAGNAIQAKFDYLYALAVAKTEGSAKYLELLKRLKENYPGTEIAQQAAYTIEVIENRNKPKVEANSLYKYDGTQTHFFGIITDEGQSDRIKTALSNFNQKYFSSSGFKTKSFLLGNKDLLGVELFNNKSEAMDYYQAFVVGFKEFIPDLPPDVKFFIVSSENFKTLLREMNAEPYLDFFKKMYL